jgi:hypothetical protein
MMRLPVVSSFKACSAFFAFSAVCIFMAIVAMSIAVGSGQGYRFDTLVDGIATSPQFRTKR